MTGPVRDILADALAELGTPSDSWALDALAALSELVAEWGQRINLTGHRDAEQVARRLVADAAALSAALPEFESLADLGSGAGFPGLPIAILRPGTRVVLVEARERRHHFQRHAIRTLGLANAEAVRGRAEEVEPRPCAAVVAQAVSGPDAIADWLLRWAEPGALLVVPGGTSERWAPGVAERVEGVETIRYQVPLGGPSRTAWVARARVRGRIGAQ